MKKSLRNNLILLMLSFLLLTCGRQQHTDDADPYTCPMHPTVVHKGPGSCPICGMDLVRKGSLKKDTSVTGNSSQIRRPVNIRSASSVKAVTPVRQNPVIELKARGEIIHNTQTLGSIPATVSGRIEKLFVRSNFQAIDKGQRILELYSPELIVAEEEFLTLMRADPENTSLIASSREKLTLFGLSDNQINELIKRQKVSRTVTIYSPVTGYIAIHESNKNTSLMEPEMPGIREGMYVTKGEEIFTIVSHRDLWAEFDIYPRDLASIKIHDTASITIGNSYGTMMASIDRIQPSFDDPQGLIKVRMRLINPHHQYHAGQHLTASFKQRTDSTLWIPASAQIDLGIDRIVFLKRNNAFRPIRISVGTKTKDWVQVVKGLKPYDSIAYNASFLIDSEDLIKAN